MYQSTVKFLLRHKITTAGTWCTKIQWNGNLHVYIAAENTWSVSSIWRRIQHSQYVPICVQQTLIYQKLDWNFTRGFVNVDPSDQPYNGIYTDTYEFYPANARLKLYPSTGGWVSQRRWKSRLVQRWHAKSSILPVALYWWWIKFCRTYRSINIQCN